MRQLKSTCCYCGVGCGVVIETDGGRMSWKRALDFAHRLGRKPGNPLTAHLT